MMSVRRFFKSSRHALRGLREVAKTEHSFRLQLVAALGVLALMVIFPLVPWQRILLLLLIAATLVLEIINSILERFSDALKPRLNPVVREVKDMMAGAVFVTSITAAIIGFIIFWPYLRELFEELRKLFVWYTL